MAMANSSRGLKAHLRRPSSEAPHSKASLNFRAVPEEGYNMAFPVYVTTQEGIHRGIARSFGPEGMFIETKEPDDIGTMVAVSFVSPYTGEELILRGRVRSRCTTDVEREFSKDVPMDGISKGAVIGMGIAFSPKVSEEMKWSCDCASKAVLYPVN